jgi:hypothetical protein
MAALAAPAGATDAGVLVCIIISIDAIVIAAMYPF